MQNRGRGTAPASVLEMAKLLEFQTPFVAGELASGATLFGVGVNDASEEDRVSGPARLLPARVPASLPHARLRL